MVSGQIATHEETDLHSLHPVVYHDWCYLVVSTTIKNKPIELFTLVLFDNSYMFRFTFEIIFRQSH
jgi:hypothetical protein